MEYSVTSLFCFTQEPFLVLNDITQKPTRRNGRWHPLVSNVGFPASPEDGENTVRKPFSTNPDYGL